MNDTSDPCQFLQWDTDFFGRRIGRIEAHRLESELINSIYCWSEEHTIDCLYFLADSNDPQTIRLAEVHGFRLVEVRITLERKLKDWNPETRPRSANDVFTRAVRAEDIPIVKSIARNSYVDSRFYFDENFPEDKWQAYYETWVEKSCRGGADLALVAEKEGEVVGYITGLVDKTTHEGIYELTGVEEAARKSGVGQELFRSGLDWYVRSGIESMWVATQGRNIATQRMIQRNGFITRFCQLYYHKWFDRPEPPME
jgi:dTDP-4-amino-4,6-dideoxy-D-galactose acyltransferase